jgi:hypothetical protein
MPDCVFNGFYSGKSAFLLPQKGRQALFLGFGWEFAA